MSFSAAKLTKNGVFATVSFLDARHFVLNLDASLFLTTQQTAVQKADLCIGFKGKNQGKI